VVLRFSRAMQAGRLGTSIIEPDADGVIRRYPVWIDAYGWQLPSLPLRRGARQLEFSTPRRQNILLNWRGSRSATRW